MPSKETFHFEVRDLICQFEDFLNEIVIRRYNANRQIQDRLKVSVVWGHKQRVLHDIVNKQGHIQLPVIAVSMGGISRDKTRVFNKLDGPYINSALSADYIHLLQPVPVDLTLNVAILTRYQIDLDQILTNFIPYTDPYIMVSWKWPDDVPGKTIEIRSAVMWNEQVNMDYQTDLQSTSPVRFIANTTFTIKGWLFKNSATPVGKIYVIDTTFTSVSDLHYNYALMQSMMYQDNTDVLQISGRPFITKVIPYAMLQCTPIEAVVFGNMMDYVCAVYVSGTQGVFPSATFHDPLCWNLALSGTSGVSAYWPGFTGVAIPSSDWGVIDKNSLSLIIPSAANYGFIDIITVNEAGYGRLSKDSSTIAPTITSYRFPYERGIEVYNISGNCLIPP